MKKPDKVIALVLVGLIIGLSGFAVYQATEIRNLTAELNEVIPLTNVRDWGAVISMKTYRADVLLSEESHHNVITDALRSALRGHIADSTLALWKYLAIGTSTGGGAGSTILVSEYSRYLGEYATVGSYNFTLSFTWTAGNFSGQTITEFGLFNDPSADTGVMFNYDDDFSRGPLTAEDALQVTVNVQIGS